MTRILLRQVVLGLFIIHAGTSQTLVWQVRQQNLWVRTLIVPTSEFDADSVERLFRRLVSENDGGGEFIDVRVYPSFEVSAANCKCQSDYNYRVWEGQFDELRSRPLPGAELISYDASSVMLFRDAAGTINRKVLSGTDPRMIGSPACSAELLYVHPSPPSLNPHVDSTEATFFFRSAKKPTEQCARELAGELRRIIQLGAFDFRVRSDAWFIEDESFPIVYAYDKMLDSPTETDYRASKEAGCFLNATRFSCWESKSR